MIHTPRIILWDIETSHNLAAVFKLYGEDYISHENLVQERYVICASWKELGAKRVSSVSVLDDPKRYKANPHDDTHVLKTLHTMLEGADVLIAHNGDQFDLKFVEARILQHTLTPLPPIPSIDTLKVARNRFLFNSNRLDYLGAYLGVGRKRPTKAGLWMRVLKGEAKAVKEMLAYNKQDVELLERVFKKLQPYVPNHINRQLFGGVGCPRCGSMKSQARGIHRAISRVYQRWQCQSCGGWWRTVKPESTSVKTRIL